jgi:hypothetical protein
MEMKARFQVEKTIKFTDFVEVELSYIDDESKDAYVKRVVSERDIRDQAFEWEEIEIIDVMAVDDE